MPVSGNGKDAMTQGSDDKKRLGRIALRKQVLTIAQDSTKDWADDGALNVAAGEDVHQQRTSDTQALQELSQRYGVPGIDLTQVCIRLQDLASLPRAIAQQHGILPVLVKNDRMFVAMVNPDHKQVIDELEFVTGYNVYPYVALEEALAVAMRDAYEAKLRGEEFYVAANCPTETRRRMGVDSSYYVSSDATESVYGADDGVPQDDIQVPSGQLQPRGIGGDSRISNPDLLNTSVELSVVREEFTEASSVRPSYDATQQLTVLVVDDEQDIRKMLSCLLTDCGYLVLEAERGLQALQLIKQQTPDIIILDAMLPEVHGFEIAKRIKGSEMYGHIPIIMISAVYRGWRYTEDAKASYGVDAYIEKPFRIEQIMRALEQVGARVSSVSSATKDRNASLQAIEEAISAGVAAYQAGDIDGAILHLERGLRVDPFAYRIHYHLGLLCGKKGLHFEAIQHLERVLDIDARHFPALKNLAILYQKTGFRNKAIEMWERCIAVAPDETTKRTIKELLLELL